MGIFDRIKSAIWGDTEAEAASSPAASRTADAPITASASGTSSRPAPSPTSAPTPAARPAATAAAPAAATKSVDVAAMLDAAVARKGQKLNWRTSIVDLMKALDLDSSLANRKELAKELNYTGDTGDSAAMNMWLHKALMKKLADNGGQVPADLID